MIILDGIYSNYCDDPLKEDRNKTCRDVGVRRKYDDKCRTDPVWLAYNRAYKTHYVRYMKKKMTTAEFEQWSRRAVELREQAEAGSILFEAYRTAAQSLRLCATGLYLSAITKALIRNRIFTSPQP